MTHVTCRLTAKNRDHLRNPTLGDRVWTTFLQKDLSVITRIAHALSVLKRCCVRPSVRLSQGQRARQQQSRAAAGDARRRLHTTRGPRKFRTDGKEVQHSLVSLYRVVSVEHYHKLMT